MVSKLAAGKAGAPRRGKQRAPVPEEPPRRVPEPQAGSSADRAQGRTVQSERAASAPSNGKGSRVADAQTRTASANHRSGGAHGQESSSGGVVVPGSSRGRAKASKTAQGGGHGSRSAGRAGGRKPMGGSPVRVVAGRPGHGGSQQTRPVPEALAVSARTEPSHERGKGSEPKDRHQRQGQSQTRQVQSLAQSQTRPAQGSSRQVQGSSASSATRGQRQMDPKERYLRKAQMVQAAKVKAEAPSPPVHGGQGHKAGRSGEGKATGNGGNVSRGGSTGNPGAVGGVETRRPTDQRNISSPRSPTESKGPKYTKNGSKSVTVGVTSGARVKDSTDQSASSSRTTNLESQGNSVESGRIVSTIDAIVEVRNPVSVPVTGEPSENRPDTSTVTVAAVIEAVPNMGNEMLNQAQPSEGTGQNGEAGQGNLDQLMDNSVARITVNARGEVARNKITQGAVSLDPSASGSPGAVAVSRPLFSASRMAPIVPAPQGNSLLPSSNALNREASDGVIEPSTLQLDIVSRGVDSGGASPEHSPIQTQHLNAGVSGSRTDNNQALPDILNSHILPPYTVRQNQHRSARQNNRIRNNQQRPANQRVAANPPGMTQLEDAEKGCCNHECCLSCVTVMTTFRWVLVSLAMLGVCCVVTGIILGALHMTVGSSFLTLSLMFIGLGVMLVVVVGVGWKCTPPGHEPCHLLFNLGDHSTRDICRSVHRRHRDRSHWYGGVSYPEFRYRRPPPSYNASMQEYQHQLMLAQIQHNTGEGGPQAPGPEAAAAAAAAAVGASTDDNYSLPSSPPPTYKSHASTVRPSLHITFPPQSEDYPNSRPPTYRSRVGTANRPALNVDMTAGPDEEDEVGVDNPACTESGHVDTQGHDQGHQNSLPVPPDSESVSSTLHRASLVTDYLDNLLENHDGTLDREVTMDSESVPEPLAEPTAERVAERVAEPVAEPVAEAEPDSTGPQNVSVPTSSEDLAKSTLSINSDVTNTSNEENNRIRDTPL